MKTYLVNSTCTISETNVCVGADLFFCSDFTTFCCTSSTDPDPCKNRPSKAPSFKPPTTSGNSYTSSSSGGCFAGTETVQLVSGEKKHLKAVKIGDEILVSSLDGKTFNYSPVEPTVNRLCLYR